MPTIEIAAIVKDLKDRRADKIRQALKKMSNLQLFMVGERSLNFEAGNLTKAILHELHMRAEYPTT